MMKDYACQYCVDADQYDEHDDHEDHDHDDHEDHDHDDLCSRAVS